MAVIGIVSGIVSAQDFRKAPDARNASGICESILLT